MAPVYDDKNGSKESEAIPHSLDDITGVTPDEEQTPSAAGDVAEREGLFNPDGDSPSRDSSPASKDSLKSGEEGGDDDDDSKNGGFFMRRANERAKKQHAQEQERIQKHEERFKNKMQGSSALKKKIAIAAAAGGGSIAVGLIAFFALLPLKIENLLDNLDQHFSAASDQALDNEVENLYSEYVAKEVLPNFLTRKDCHSTVDASCVSVSSDTGPIGRLYNSWTQGRLEQKMAENENIMIGRKGNTFYMNVGGASIKESDLLKIQNGESLFNLSGTTTATRNEIRTAVKDGLKDETFYNRVYLRFKFGKLLEAKYGIKRCVIACDTRDTFADKVSDKKLAAKAYIVQRVVSPFSQSAGLIIQCIMDGSCKTDTDGSALTGDPNDPEKSSNFQNKLKGQLDSYAEKYGDDKLSQLVATASGISKDGFSKYMFKQAMGQTGTTIAEDAGEEEAEDDNPVGVINVISQIVKFVNDIGPAVKKINYAIGTAAAVQMYMTFRTVADEVHNGHVDPTELGSFTNQLDNDGVDASSTPLYSQLMGGNSGTDTTASIFSPASADGVSTGTVSNGVYKCADDKTVPAPTAKDSTYPVCNEEVFDGGNAFTTSLTADAKAIPGWSFLSTIAGVEQKISGLANKLIGPILNNIPGFGSISNLLNKAISPLFSLITGKLIISPLKDASDGIVPSGGRTFDLIAGGDDVSQNKACQTQLGCAAVSPTVTADYANQAMEQQKQAFDHESMFARMFDTSSSYSLVSRLADDLPTSFVSGTNNLFASLLSDPFGKLTSAFGSLFSANHAFALDNSDKDPFGIQQYAYTPAQLQQLDAAVAAAGGYSNYWQQNCSGDYMTAWENSQQLDPNTGDAVSTTTNPCMLVNAAIQSAGGYDNSSLLPAGSTNGDD